MKINLLPLQSEVAQAIATHRGISVDKLIEALLNEEAAIALVHWRRGLNDSNEKVNYDERQPQTA